MQDRPGAVDWLDVEVCAVQFAEYLPFDFGPIRIGVPATVRCDSEVDSALRIVSPNIVALNTVADEVCTEMTIRPRARTTARTRARTTARATARTATEIWLWDA